MRFSNPEISHEIKSYGYKFAYIEGKAPRVGTLNNVVARYSRFCIQIHTEVRRLSISVC